MSKTLADILRSYIPDGDGYNSEYAHNLNAAADALESQQSTPAGYVLVPVEPTPEMRLAGKRTIKGAADCSEGEQAEYAYMQMVAAAPKAEQPPVQEPLDQYDAGLLNDFGGGDVEWWQDYIRAELGRAHDFYQSQIVYAAPQPVAQEPVAWSLRFPEGENHEVLGRVNAATTYQTEAAANAYADMGQAMHPKWRAVVVPLYAAPQPVSDGDK